MILYHALTIFHFLNCAVHRLLYHPYEKAVLLIDENDLPRFGHPNYRALIEAGIFDEIHRFSSAQILDSFAVSSLTPYFDDLLRPNRIQDFIRIYIAGIHSDFAVYLSNRHIRFSAFEDSPGLLSRQHEFIAGLSKNFPLRYRLLKKYGLDNFSCLEIERIFFNEGAQLADFRDPRTEAFDAAAGFMRLDESKRASILDWFRIDGIDRSRIETGTALLLTQSLSSNGFMSFENECRMTKKIVSTYATESSLIIKPHPDNLLPLEAMFPDAYVLPAVFPLELFPMIIPGKISSLIHIDSAGARAIRTYFNETVTLYWDYLKSYNLEDEYKSVLAQIKKIPGLKTILTAGIDRHHFDALTNRIAPELTETVKFRIDLSTPGQMETAAPLASEGANFVVIDSENVRESTLNQINLILDTCLNHGGRVAVINNLRGVSAEEKFPILKSAKREVKLISAGSETGAPKRLVLFYTQPAKDNSKATS